MAYIRTGLGHSQEACCAQCAAGKACSQPTAQGDLFEFKMSSIVPWLLVIGIGYLVFKTPESHGQLVGTARSELGRAHGAAKGAITKFRTHSAKRATKRRYGRR